MLAVCRLALKGRTQGLPARGTLEVYTSTLLTSFRSGLHVRRRPQLGCLHLLDMPQEQRAKLVQAFPRILTVDVETGLLALLMYMQARNCAASAQCTLHCIAHLLDCPV